MTDGQTSGCLLCSCMVALSRQCGCSSLRLSLLLLLLLLLHRHSTCVVTSCRRLYHAVDLTADTDCTAADRKWQMWNRPVFLAHILLRCPPRLCPWSATLRHVHHSSQYPHFLLFPQPSPLRGWHSALSFLPSDTLWLQRRSPSQCSRSNFILDDCKSSYTELLRDWISAHWFQ